MFVKISQDIARGQFQKKEPKAVSQSGWKQPELKARKWGRLIFMVTQIEMKPEEGRFSGSRKVKETKQIIKDLKYK